jgi:hypothetical protein
MTDGFIDLKDTPLEINWHRDFIKAIHAKTKIRLTFYSKQDGEAIVRLCAPMDYGPKRKIADQSDRYHLWDYESATSFHPLSLLPEQIIKMEFIGEPFEPSFVNWTPNWFVPRDWGKFS